MVTIFIFPPVGFILGVKAYRQHRRELTNPQDRNLLVAAFPMLFAAMVFALEFWLVSTGYRA